MNAPSGDKPKSTRYRLTARQKQEAILLYQRGEKTAQQLADRFGLSLSGMQKMLQRAKVKKGERAEEVQQKVAEQIEGRTVDQVNEIVSRIEQSKEETYKIAAFIRRLIGIEMQKARSEGRAVSSIKESMRALVMAGTALKLTQEVVWETLGIKPDDVDPDALPDLPLREIDDETAQRIARESENNVGLDDLDMVEESAGDLSEPAAGTSKGA